MNPSSLQMEQGRMGEPRVNTFNRGLYSVSMMKVEAVFQPDGLPLAHPISTLFRFLLAVEMPVPEGVSRKKSIVPDMPMGRVAEAHRVVHDGYPDLLALDRTVIINPFSWLAPAL